MIPKGRVHVEDHPGRYNHHAWHAILLLDRPACFPCPTAVWGPHLCCAFPGTPPYPLGENLQTPWKQCKKQRYFQRGFDFIFSLNQRPLSMKFSKSYLGISCVTGTVKSIHSRSYIYFVFEWHSGWLIFWIFIFSIKFSTVKNLKKQLFKSHQWVRRWEGKVSINLITTFKTQYCF